MEILFKNTTEYNKNEMDKFFELHNKKSKFYVRYLYLLAILLVGMSIFNIVNKNWKWFLYVIVFLALLFAYYKFFKIPKQEKTNKSNYDQKFTFYFYEKYMTTKCNNVDTGNYTYYFQFDKIYETKDNFYLYLNDDYSYILSKDGFNKGTAEDFRTFIKKKCILKYRKKIPRIKKQKNKKIKNEKKKSKEEEIKFKNV